MAKVYGGSVTVEFVDDIGEERVVSIGNDEAESLYYALGRTLKLSSDQPYYISDVDYYEKDALLNIADKQVYFQFDEAPTIQEAIKFLVKEIEKDFDLTSVRERRDQNYWELMYSNLYNKVGDMIYQLNNGHPCNPSIIAERWDELSKNLPYPKK